MTVYTERAKGSPLTDFIAENVQLLSIAIFFSTCLLFFSVVTDFFLTAGNLLNIVRQAAPILIVSVAMTLVIITGGIDLSVGSMVALINAVGAILLASGHDWLLVLLAMLALGGGVGLLQGWFIAYQVIPAFIVTLAGLSILRGIALYITQGYSVPIPDVSNFFYLGRGDWLNIPVPGLIAFLITILAYGVLSFTRYGRSVVAVGSNLEAARRAGMPAKWILASVYLIAGMASAIAGLLIAARLGSGSSNAAVGFELQVIAAVVLGGTSLMGGRGTILGTLLGAMTITVIGNGLILMHISPFFTQIATGAIILTAIWLNTRIFNANFRFGTRRKVMRHDR